MLAGGWVTPSVAKDYCHPTHAWSCERRMQLPVPVDWLGGGTGSAFQYRSEERLGDSLWARWIRADLRDGAPQGCPGTQASEVGTKRSKRSKSSLPDPLRGSIVAASLLSASSPPATRPSGLRGTSGKSHQSLHLPAEDLQFVTGHTP